MGARRIPEQTDPKTQAAIYPVAKSQISFSKLMEHSYAGVTLLDKNLRVIYRSPSSERITGWNAANIKEHSTISLTHPNDVPLVEKLIKAILAHPGEPVTGRFRIRHFLGHYIWLDCTLNNLLDEPGIEAIVFNFQDVSLQAKIGSEKQQWGEDVHHQQMAEELELLFDRAPDMIAIMGVDRYFKKVNPAMCNLLEYTEHELLKLPLDVLIHPDDLAVSQQRTKTFLQGGDQTLSFENRFVNKSGKPIWLSWTASRSAEDGFIFCVGKNISDKKEIENLLHKVNELAQIGSWDVDRVKGTIYWSSITRDIYEVSEDFVPAIDNWLTFFVEGRDRDYIAGKMADLIETGKPCDAEVEIETAKGNRRWIRAVAEAEFVSGKCVRVYGSFQDIDYRKKAELAAVAALKQRDEILEGIGDGFFAVDRNWITTYWNKAAEQIIGRSRNEMLGKYFWDLYPDAAELDFYQQYQKAIATGKAVRFEEFYPATQAWFSVNAYPSENGLSVFFKDITEVKQAAQAIVESEKRYSDLFHLSPQPMFVYEMSTLRYLDVNLAAIEHYGYSREEFLSMTIFDIRPEEDKALIEGIVAERQNQIKVRFEDVFRHRKKNGEIMRVGIQSNIISYHGIKCKVVLANDMTEQMHYIETIEAQNEKLKEISWMQSHVIRAPLSRIMGLLPMLKYQSEDCDQKQIYNFLIESANELDAVIHSITDVTNVIRPK